MESHQSPPGQADGDRQPPRTIQLLLRGATIATVVLLGALLADILFGWTLPQPVRPALPILLAVALALALVIGVGFYGAPKRPGGPAGADD